MHKSVFYLYLQRNFKFLNMPNHQLTKLLVSNQKTILIVEDEKSLRGALVDILRLKNFKTAEAKNGREGVDMALLMHPDLILLDIIMPEMDGLTTLKKLRDDSWGKNVPVIMLTNLGAVKDQLLVDDKVAERPTYYLIKSDWKLHDSVKKIDQILSI